MRSLAIMLISAAVFCTEVGAQDGTDAAIWGAVERAAKARDAGRMDDAKREIMGAAAIAGDVVRYRRSLAADLLDFGFAEPATQVCEQTIPKAPDDPVLHGLLGIAHFRARRFPDAITELTLATSKQPGRKEWWLALGRAHLQANQEAAALAAVDRARGLAPDDVDVLEVKAECEYRNMRMPQCEESCRTLLAKNPKNLMGWQLLIRVRRTQGRADDARTAADDAIKAVGRHPEIVLERGLILLAQNRNEEAVAELLDVASHLREDARPQLHLCKAYTRLGQTKEAAAAKARYLELSPDLRKAPASRKN